MDHMQSASRDINEFVTLSTRPFLEYHLQQYFPPSCAAFLLERLLRFRTEETPPVLVPEATLHHVRLLIGAHSLSSFLTGLGVRLWLFGPASPTMAPETETVGRLADSLHALIRGTDAEGSSEAREIALLQLCRKVCLALPASNIWWYLSPEA
ncbi:hypothetical protein ASPBRDRAFT_657882, partial [Aspergillus brasiliensis CBS 101740]